MTSAISGDDVVSTARTYLGVPYSWGGASPSGFDCSGFTDYVLGRLGINIGRTTVDQYGTGYPIQLGPADNPMLYAQPGDLIFFGMGNQDLASQHVGIYVGNNTMIDSPNSTSSVRYDNVLSWGPDEPISGIRRVTTGGNSAPGALLMSDTTGATGAGSTQERCLVKAPSQSFGLFTLGGNCLIGTPQARALLGSMIILGGGVLMLGGVAIIVSSGKQAQLLGALTRLPGVGRVQQTGTRQAPSGAAPLSEQDKADLDIELFTKRNQAEDPGAARRNRNTVARDRRARAHLPDAPRRDLTADEQRAIIARDDPL